jgi:hypothetical protein
MVGDRQETNKHFYVIDYSVMFFTSYDKRQPFPATQPFNDFI